jgi:SAM-dependent methyltransferase
MNGLTETAANGRLDWDAAYREGTPFWETGVPSAELIRVLDEGLVRPGMVLEIGCGTGADAVEMVKRGFEVTAVDSSPTAIERARVRAEREDALPRFVLADIFEFAQTAGQFDFIYDAGFYPFIRQYDLGRYLDVLWRVTRPGSLYLTLAGAAGAAGEAAENGPPRVSKRQIYLDLGRLLETVRLTNCRLESPFQKAGYPAWLCLMRRPVLGQ